MRHVIDFLHRFFTKPVINKSNKKEKDVCSNIVYCYRVTVPSKYYEITLYAYNELDALYQTVRIMKLANIPDDLKIVAYSDPIDSDYWNTYIFRNKKDYICNIKDYSF